MLADDARRPRRTIARKSEGLTTRFALASTSLGYAESSVRPLERRAERMARPARVRMRRRKPCFLARRRLFGWNVRLLILLLRLSDLRVSQDLGRADLDGDGKTGCPNG